MSDHGRRFATDDDEAQYYLSMLREGTRDQKIEARDRLSRLFQSRGLFGEACELLESNVSAGVRERTLFLRLASLYGRLDRPADAAAALREAHSRWTWEEGGTADTSRESANVHTVSSRCLAWCTQRSLTIAFVLGVISGVVLRSLFSIVRMEDEVNTRVIPDSAAASPSPQSQIVQIARTPSQFSIEERYRSSHKIDPVAIVYLYWLDPKYRVTHSMVKKLDVAIGSAILSPMLIADPQWRAEPVVAPIFLEQNGRDMMSFPYELPKNLAALDGSIKSISEELVLFSRKLDTALLSVNVSTLGESRQHVTSLTSKYELAAREMGKFRRP